MATLNLDEVYDHLYDTREKVPKAKKFREYFIELVSMSGLDDTLLRTAKMGGQISKKSQYSIPEEDVPFIDRLLQLRSKEDFTKMRRRNFMEANLDVREKILFDWKSVLEHLGYERRVVDNQLWDIDRRLGISLSKRQALLVDRPMAFKKIASDWRLDLPDQVILLDFVINHKDMTEDEVSKLQYDYTELRQMEIYEQAELETRMMDAEANERYALEWYIDSTIADDPEYKAVQKEIDQFLAGKGILWRDKAKLNRLLKKRQEIRVRHEQAAFGEKLPPMPEPEPAKYRHPMEVLLECLQNHVEEELEQAEFDKKSKEYRERLAKDENLKKLVEERFGRYND